MTIRQKKRKILISAVLVLFGVFGWSGAMAVPVLQLDIVGGIYDPETESVIASGDSLELLAIATPGGKVSSVDILSGQFVVSAAIFPAHEGFGSFSINGVPYTPESMLYGMPPANAERRFLGEHDVFDTYFAEIPVNFSEADTVTTYNVQDNPGGALIDQYGEGSFFATIQVNIEGLVSGLALHFDLFKLSNINGQTNLDYFAPFSHDATVYPELTAVYRERVNVPEPGSVATLGTGLMIFWFVARRKRKSRTHSVPET